ncbi:MAG TPA: response regulator transcription factor [Sphingomicrobium sp.]
MKLLLVEDDPQTAIHIAQGLAELGHQVDSCATGSDALAKIIDRHRDYDAVILDRLLPELDGVDVVSEMRKAGIRLPVLMLTALGSIEDRVEGLEAGADDYLVKPFALPELVARLNAIMRRAGQTPAPQVLTAGGIEIDRFARSVSRAGRRIVLQPREFQLLEQLMLNAGRFVTRRLLLESVWGFSFDPRTNIVEAHMSRLRGKLNEGFPTDAIETVRGSGYRIGGDA